MYKALDIQRQRPEIPFSFCSSKQVTVGVHCPVGLLAAKIKSRSRAQQILSSNNEIAGSLFQSASGEGST